MPATLEAPSPHPQWCSDPRKWERFKYHPTQSALVKSQARFKIVEAPRRSGKTATAKRDIVREWSAAPYETGLSDWFGACFAPTRDQAKAIYWEDLKAMVPTRLVKRVYESDLTIRHVDGAILACIGMDKPARAEGRPIDRANVDEFADMKQGVWARNLRPALDTPGRLGHAWIYGVPRPSAQFQELAEYAKSGQDPEWEYFYWGPDGILSEQQLAAARRESDERTFAQEYLGHRVPLSGRAYYTFDRAIHVVESLPYDENAPLILCLDFNVSPGAAVICQEATDVSKGACTHVLGEVAIPRDSNTPLVIERFLADWGGHKGPIHYYGDPTGGNRGTAKVAGSDWDLVFQHLRPTFGGRLEDHVERKLKPERLRVNALNARMKNAGGDVRLKVVRSTCQHLIRDLDNVVVKEGTDGAIHKELDQRLTHWSDALAYYVEARFPLAETRIVREAI